VNSGGTARVRQRGEQDDGVEPGSVALGGIQDAGSVESFDLKLSWQYASFFRELGIGHVPVLLHFHDGP
jgi:hypothetical protein